jgi:(p)ppGpp synthase/HD superfamily hydrolase
MVERSGYPDQVVAAAVLHDVLEDTDTQRRELRERFGPEVAELVAVLSDDPTITDQDVRRDDVRARAREAGGDALVIYAADKVSKVRELRALIAGGLDPKEAESKRSHYAKCLAMLEETAPDDRLVELLRFEMETLATLPPGTAPQA